MIRHRLTRLALALALGITLLPATPALAEAPAVRTQVPGEVQSTTQSRNLLDAHFVRRLTPALNLRLSVQNLLGKGTWRTASTGQGGQAWVLTSSETGQRTWLLTLEGKW